jgi:hypothetical protein
MKMVKHVDVTNRDIYRGYNNIINSKRFIWFYLALTERHWN